ncbi:MAG: Crp/Fnr family transcriptional regulator [Candidatus Portnoybacteria bacterium]|nr:Crp/Fnr family transcriptional regulator [Candidatus Portnoybacteria bacterium]
MDKTLLGKFDVFFKNHRERAYKKGEIILHNFESVSSLYYLQKGYVRQFVITRDGEEVTIHIFRPGSLFPLMLSFAGAQNRYTFQALTHTVVRQAPQDKVLDFLKREPSLLIEIVQRFAKGLLGLSLRIERFSSTETHEKLISLLLYLSSRFGKSIKKSKAQEIMIDLPLTHQEIASWIGRERETVSRQMEKLKRKKLIDYKGKSVFVKNLEKLKQELTRPSRGAHTSLP